MSGDASSRSNLIDVTYQQLHTILSGHLEGVSQDSVYDILKYRVEQLRNLSQPFGKPTDASKKRIQSGSVTLRDGFVLKLEEADKTFVFAVSKHFGIDEVDALVLMRSFLYNEGLPSDSGSNSSTTLVDELLEAITPFYYAERLFVLRCLIPLFRATAAPEGLLYAVANEWVPKIINNGNTFAETLIEEYKKKLHLDLPADLETQPKKASLWVKQNAREQLVLLEVLFWTMWDNATCDGPLVELVYQTAYGTNLGSNQKNGALLMDEEGAQIGQDSAALWILLTIEVLELERVAEPGGIQISDNPTDKDIYWAAPDSLQRIHHLITTHQNSQFACAYLAWAFVLSRLVQTASDLKEIPKSYSRFFDNLISPSDRAYQKDSQPVHVLMAHTCLQPDVGLFNLLLTLLTNSPFFVTAVAWRTGSTVTDPNAVAYRSVLKGLIIALVELVPVEHIPDFDNLVEVWISLFGRSESKSVSGICRQFWQSDWSTGIARRAILDVARSRFPIHCRPFLRLLRAMTAVGFLDTDALSTADHGSEGEPLHEDRELCARHVFYHFQRLPTFTQVVPASACTGAHALYEKVPERYSSSSVVTPLTYANLHPIKLPGGSILPPRSTGRLLNAEGGDLVVIQWAHEHSGWKVILEILTDYVNRRRLYSGNSYHDVSFGRKKEQHTALSLKDIGVEMEESGDELVVVDALDLIRSVIQDNPVMAEALLEALEAGDAVVAHNTTETSSPDLVQLTTTILEEALSRSDPQQRNHPRSSLITSAMSVLTALLALPKYSNRVWLYIRSTASLFGSERNVGITSAVLATERLTGHYTMTLALLHLVQQLFNEASSSVLTVLQHTPKLQQVKEDVLMRAARFVHSEIWIEHVGWKYAQVGDRFEIGRRVANFYTAILKNASPSLPDVPFAKLSQSITDALLYKATMSAVHPIISSITGGSSMVAHLLISRRFGDARRLIYLMESNLILIRTLLHCKQQSPLSSTPCLLEEALCSRGLNGNISVNPASKRADPVDALVAFIKERGMGTVVPQEATRVLFALCGCLSGLVGTQLSVVGHMSDPEAAVSSLVRIVLHPYDDALLRNAVWNFITLAVDKEPALANLFVSGYFRPPSTKGKEKADDAGSTKVTSAFSVARDMIEQWKGLWELNPQLLASLMRFLDVIWEHGHEHEYAMSHNRDDRVFWDSLAAIVKEELGPVPDFKTDSFLDYEGVQHSNLHEAISNHAYRTVVKAHAVRIIAMDVSMSLQSQDKSQALTKPISYITIQSVFKSEEQFTDLLWEGASRTYDPALHDDLLEHLRKYFPTLDLKHVQVQEPVVERTFGDDFAFSLASLLQRLQPFLGNLGYEVDEALRMLSSINLNLSLAHAQTSLTQSWQQIMTQVTPFLRGEAPVRATLMSIAANISEDIAGEKRSGDMVSTVHHSRLSLLLALLESAWFSTTDKGKEVQDFISLVKNVRGIIQNRAQSPAKSFLGQVSTPFHRVVLQIAYYCARQGTSLVLRPKALKAEERLAISFMVEATLILSIDALRISFDAARVRMDLDVDQDLELLVAVFELCTRPKLNPSPTFWLTRCQETDVIRASLELFSSMDLVGFNDLNTLRFRGQPLYAPQVLSFHMALAGITASAERLASDSVLSAYSDNPLSAAIKAGSIDVVLPELPGVRSPAHAAYCTMLAVVAAVTTSLGRFGHFFDVEVCGLIQLYGDQIHRTLSWTIADPLTLPLLEEIEQTIALFTAVAQSSAAVDRNEAAKRALNFFVSDALLLLQQVNYGLTHPNHLASTFEPITAAEKSAFERESTNVTSSIGSPSDMIDPMKRPFLARLLHRLFRLSGNIVSALISVCGAEVVLTDEPEEWPREQILIVPHAKVVLGEPTSIGTLLELGNRCLDVVRHLVDRPPTQAITPLTAVDDGALDVQESVATIRNTLEATLFYAVTQLAMWLAKPEFEGSAKEAETDDGMMMGESESMKDRERKPKRQSMTMAERLRRGMTGEMASDVQALLNRAKPVVAKTDTVLGKKGIDLTAVLSRFVQEKIVVPS
ncbi:hypothetical protein BXZ70DRAFT_991345 [Cristinia sonorae]|uniref:Nucleoporin Nup188 N-terminal subdomain III domain-containing protein n=1 Tax=Cristinia sonorae TaxID=1940300 RepID=A0A8K0UM67_9AGAR|nr:hypothetical protein BXZ70DRAFT_991345 [Cristinia sonorae]